MTLIMVAIKIIALSMIFDKIAASSSCPPETGIYLMLNGSCVNNGTYFRDSNLQIAGGRNGYIHCVLPNETLAGGEWLRPDGNPVDCNNGVQARLSNNDPKLINPFFCADDKPHANISMYLLDDDYFRPTAFVNQKFITDLIETEYKCCLPNGCSDPNTMIMTINVFERIYITDFYVDLPSDITVLPQTYTVHCIVTGGVDEGAIIKLYYEDNPDTELTQSTCTNNNDGYNCAVNDKSIKTNNTYPATKDYEIIIEWDAKKIENGIFRQSSQHDADHRFLCTAAFGAITASHKGRNKSVTIKAPSSSPTALTLVNKTHATITISWEYPSIGDCDGYVVNASSADGFVIKVIDNNNTPVVFTINELLSGNVYNITVRAYQDILGLSSDGLLVNTLDEKPEISWILTSSIENLLKMSYSINCTTNGVNHTLVTWVMNGDFISNSNYTIINETEKDYINMLTLYPNNDNLGQSVNVTCSIENVTNTTLTLEAPSASPQNVNLNIVNETAMTITWTTQIETDGFILIVTPGDGTIHTMDTEATVTNLLPGTTYNISVYAYKDLLSKPTWNSVYLNFINAPNAVNNLSATAVSFTGIKISWQISDIYRVKYIQIRYNSSCSVYKTVTVDIIDLSVAESDHSYTHNVSDLYSGMNYTLSVRAGNPVGLSQAVFVNEELLPTISPSGAPDPNTIMLYPIDEYKYKISWSEIKCFEKNGHMTGYMINVKHDGLNSTANTLKTFLVISVIKRSILTIRIAAKNEIGVGPYCDPKVFNLQDVVGSVNINLLSPSKRGPSWLYISWGQPTHIPEQYPIQKYEIGIINIMKKCTDDWKQQTDQLTRQTNVTEQQCNITDLLPETCYAVFIRAHTIHGYGPWNSDAFNTTAFIIQNTTISHSTDMNDLTGILIPVLVTLAVILIILLVLVTSLTIAIIAILRLRCRRKKKRNQTEYTYEDMNGIVSGMQTLPLRESGEAMDGCSSNSEMPVYETIRPKLERDTSGFEKEIHSLYENYKEVKYY